MNTNQQRRPGESAAPTSLKSTTLVRLAALTSATLSGMLLGTMATLLITHTDSAAKPLAPTTASPFVGWETVPSAIQSRDVSAISVPICSFSHSHLQALLCSGGDGI